MQLTLYDFKNYINSSVEESETNTILTYNSISGCSVTVELEKIKHKQESKDNTVSSANIMGMIEYYNMFNNWSRTSNIFLVKSKSIPNIVFKIVDNINKLGLNINKLKTTKANRNLLFAMNDKTYSVYKINKSNGNVELVREIALDAVNNNSLIEFDISKIRNMSLSENDINIDYLETNGSSANISTINIYENMKNIFTCYSRFIRVHVKNKDKNYSYILDVGKAIDDLHADENSVVELYLLVPSDGNMVIDNNEENVGAMRNSSVEFEQMKDALLEKRVSSFVCKNVPHFLTGYVVALNQGPRKPNNQPISILRQTISINYDKIMGENNDFSGVFGGATFPHCSANIVNANRFTKKISGDRGDSVENVLVISSVCEGSARSILVNMMSKKVKPQDYDLIKHLIVSPMLNISIPAAFSSSFWSLVFAELACKSIKSTQESKK